MRTVRRVVGLRLGWCLHRATTTTGTITPRDLWLARPHGCRPHTPRPNLMPPCGLRCWRRNLAAAACTRVAPVRARRATWEADVLHCMHCRSTGIMRADIIP